MKKINKLIKRMWHDLWEKNDGTYFFFLYVAIITCFIFPPLIERSVNLSFGFAVCGLFMSLTGGMVIGSISIIVICFAIYVIEEIVNYFKKIVKEEL